MPEQNNSSNKFTAEQMIEIQRIQEQLTSMHAVFWTNFSIFESSIKFVLYPIDFLNQFDQDESLKPWKEWKVHIALITFLLGTAGSLLLLKRVGLFDIARNFKDKLVFSDKLLKKLSPNFLASQIIEKSHVTMSYEEVQKDIHDLKEVLFSHSWQKSWGRFMSRFLATLGCIDLLMRYFPSDYKYKEVFYFLPFFIKDHTIPIFFIELIVHTLQAVYSTYNSVPDPSKNAEVHLQELRTLFSTKKWIKKTTPFNHSSLKTDSAQIPITLSNQNNHINIQIPRELFFRTIASYLIQMKVPILFFSDQHIVIRDWNYTSFDTKKIMENFQGFLQRCYEIETFKSAKGLQLTTIIQNCNLQNMVKYRHIETFESNGLPQIQFVIEMPNVLSEQGKKQILEFEVKLSDLYGENSVIVSNNTIVVSGCQCVSSDKVESTKTKIHFSDINASNDNNYQVESFKPKTNKKLKEEKKKEKEPPLSKKYQMIRDNILSRQNKLNADEIAKNLTGQAAESANDDIYFPLATPDREPGTTYAKVNRTILKKRLFQKDDKNYKNNKVDLDHCIKKISAGHVGGASIIPTNEFCTKDLPTNNNNEAPSKWLAQSFFKVRNDKVSLYATSSQKIILPNSNTEIECFNFDYLKLD